MTADPVSESPSRFPPEFIMENVIVLPGVKFFNIPVEELTREELLAVIGWLCRELQENRDKLAVFEMERLRRMFKNTQREYVQGA